MFLELLLSWFAACSCIILQASCVTGMHQSVGDFVSGSTFHYNDLIHVNHFSCQWFHGVAKWCMPLNLFYLRSSADMDLWGWLSLVRAEQEMSDFVLSGVHSRLRDTLVCCVDSPAETSDFCRPELWRVRRSQLLLICSLSCCGSGLSWTESSNPSGFHVLNWKRTEKPPTAGDADGSDRKLLLELTKVQATSWGCEHEKVTLPWRTKKPRMQIYMHLAQYVRCHGK